MNRRKFLTTAAAAASLPAVSKAASMPVIDTHIHLFDPRRPQGIPWPEKTNVALYKPALPDRYRKLAVPHGVVGAIEVEASAWLEDNQWVLDIAEKDPIIVGTVGDLEPGKAGFAKNLERFHRNPLFLGIRYGNIWNRDLAAEVKKAEFISDMKLVAAAGLSFDTANPDPALIEAVVRLTDQIPNLRAVVDHLPQLQMPADAAAAKVYRSHLHQLGKRPQVYVKLSQIYRRTNGQVPRDLSVYRANLDEIFGVFGEDRVLYGSDWPNSDNWRPYDDIFNVAKEYISAKGQKVAEKYFWRNSIKAYRWVKRDPSQPSA